MACRRIENNFTLLINYYAMEKIKTFLNALIGYAGSSENPQKMSMRFMGILMGLISQFSPIIALIVERLTDKPTGVAPEVYIQDLITTIQPIMLSIACVLWVIGAIGAVMRHPKVAGILKR